METQRRWVAWVGLVLCLWSGFGLAAQGTFLAKNSETNAITGFDYVELLSKVTGRVEIVVGGMVLPLLGNTLVADGLFDFGIVTIAGLAPGSTASITVRAWDITRGATYADVVRSDGAANWSMFDVVLGGGGSEPPGQMSDFRGLSICRGVPVPPPRSIATQEGQPVIFSVSLGLYYDFYGRAELTAQSIVAQNQRPSFPLAGHPKGLLLGSVTGTNNQVSYTPRLRTYGTDVVYYPINGTGCFALGVGSGVLFFDIQPSPARLKPTLSISSAKRPRLLGLNGRRYRIEKSADLTVWALAGEVTGNFSEVDLSPFLAPDDRAQFFRATEITGP